MSKENMAFHQAVIHFASLEERSHISQRLRGQKLKTSLVNMKTVLPKLYILPQIEILGIIFFVDWFFQILSRRPMIYLSEKKNPHELEKALYFYFSVKMLGMAFSFAVINSRKTQLKSYLQNKSARMLLSTFK